MSRGELREMEEPGKMAIRVGLEIPQGERQHWIRVGVREP